MPTLDLDEDQLTKAIEDAYDLQEFDVPAAATETFATLLGAGPEQSGGPTRVYVGTPTLGRKYNGLNPKDSPKVLQTYKKFIL